MRSAAMQEAPSNQVVSYELKQSFLCGYVNISTMASYNSIYRRPHFRNGYLQYNQDS